MPSDAPSFNAFSFFATSTSSANAFTLFIPNQSPRETHIMYEDLRGILRPSNAYQEVEYGQQRRSAFSRIFRLKRLLKAQAL
ncbi:hypothetical protein EDD18DRAFT_1158581 [Armillaria luteobubalina]|uniref:Uncharacterized protein n=1 Tax=Armillaria luteobubalina TaxID=153913 RepID=A0AA39QBG6_9AGAR|nr:hypothetical protein EDD18DRAFT_1158581 [Armillaria luteobubalina]